LGTDTDIAITGSGSNNKGLILNSQNAVVDLNGRTLNFTTNNAIINCGSSTVKTFKNGVLSIDGSVNVTSGGATLVTDTNTIVKLQRSFNPGNALTTINGTLQININGSITGNSPRYGSSSLLQYNSTGSYSRNLEWTSDIATIGTTPGYPNNVQISNSTTLNYYRATNTGPKGINGDLVIDAGSSLSFGTTTTGGA